MHVLQRFTGACRVSPGVLDASSFERWEWGAESSSCNVSATQHSRFNNLCDAPEANAGAQMHGLRAQVPPSHEIHAAPSLMRCYKLPVIKLAVRVALCVVLYPGCCCTSSCCR